MDAEEAEEAPAGAEAEEEEEEGEAAEGLYFSTSALRMRPSGPVPLIWERGMPCSRAMRLAMGEAKMMERFSEGESDFSDFSCLGAAGFESSLAWGFSAAGFSSVLASGAACSSPPSLRRASTASAETSSPSSPRMAATDPTLTSLVPSPICGAHGRGVVEQADQRPPLC